ncbi:MAG: hypothetical protein RL328_1731, partial [Acidobacteriota bacterium]
MYLRSARIIALLALVISTLVAQRPATMRAFWQDSVKGPLTGPGSDQLFISTYKDAHLPPTDMRPYFEGSVVSVSSGTGGQSVLLTVE